MDDRCWWNCDIATFQAEAEVVLITPSVARVGFYPLFFSTVNVEHGKRRRCAPGSLAMLIKIISYSADHIPVGENSPTYFFADRMIVWPVQSA